MDIAHPTWFSYSTVHSFVDQAEPAVLKEGLMTRPMFGSSKHELSCRYSVGKATVFTCCLGSAHGCWSTTIFVVGRASTSLEKLKVAPDLNGKETAFLNED